MDALTASAWLFDIYRGTSHDGPGLRSTVFFQGCPLRCPWCHNPEGLQVMRRVWWEERSCIGCGQCAKACPSGAVVLGGKGVAIDTSNCVRCGACVEGCPARALTFTACLWSLDALVDELMKDSLYYEKTGGGVTASGGECLLQYAFVSDLFKALKSRGVDTALDTSGHVPWAHLEQVLPYTDHVLYDVKILDSTLHQAMTGEDNALILRNLRRIAAQIHDGTTRVDLWIRTPLIPGATATRENIHAISRFLANELEGTVTRWELPAFNNSCISKYKRLGQPWIYESVQLLDGDDAAAMLEAAIEGGMPKEKIAVTGLVAEKRVSSM